MDLRLKKQSDFDFVFKKGKKCYGKSMLMVYVKSRDTKIGFSVSKKNGGAVVRNRIKRYFRAAFNEYKNYLIGDYYIVFVPKKSDEYSFFAFKEDISFLLKKEKLIDG
ncbi:MAG: ribonuclease P protein component [Candidatus Borkfalkiaceae bacterium]|nr:ribonuclease P protein component [Christensenellaceae bacterium]